MRVSPRRKNRFFVVLTLLLLSTTLFTALAQTPDREDSRPFVKFEITGGRDDNRLYYTADVPNYPRMMKILDTIVPVYNTITGQPWTMQVVFPQHS